MEKREVKKLRVEDLSVNGKIILKFVLNKYDGMPGSGFIWFRTEAASICFKVASHFGIF